MTSSVAYTASGEYKCKATYDIGIVDSNTGTLEVVSKYLYSL